MTGSVQSANNNSTTDLRALDAEQAPADNDSVTATATNNAAHKALSNQEETKEPEAAQDNAKTKLLSKSATWINSAEAFVKSHKILAIVAAVAAVALLVIGASIAIYGTATMAQFTTSFSLSSTSAAKSAAILA